MHKGIIYVCFLIIFLFFKSMAYSQVNDIDDYAKLAIALNTTTEEIYAKLHFEASGDATDTDKNFFLKPFKESDKKASCDIVSFEDTSENRQYMQYYGNGKSQAIDACQNLFDIRLKRMYDSDKPKELYLMMHNSNSHEVMGQITTSTFPNPSVAYIVLKDFKGKQYATHALIMLIEFIKTYFPEVNSITADAHPDNIASDRVLLHAGFTKNPSLVQREGKGPRYQYVINLKENIKDDI